MPRSRHADEFNHDEDAAGYDADVRNEHDPIRAGYAALLDWLAREAAAGIGADATVLELGSGTGNLTQRLPRAQEIVCVDVSSEMHRLAKEKLAGRDEVRFVESDLLEYFDPPGPDFDVVVSSYAIHHLTEAEKAALFAHVARRLRPGGRIAFGDLMFRSGGERADLFAEWRATGRAELADDVEEEFFWDLGEAERALRALGFELTTRRFSELSWGISGVLRP
jgi:putative AdoMet-dependent methyltransferase